MKRTIAIYILVLGLVFAMQGLAQAGDSWQLEMVARLQNASNKLIIGQNATASDSVDGRHDIPALLSGDIQAYMFLDGQQLWKDLRASCTGPCEKQWNLVIESPLTGELIELHWDPNEIPAYTNLVLVDKATGFKVEMNQEAGVTFSNTGKRELVIVGTVQ